MAITRRTEVFDQLATEIESRLVVLEVAIDAAVIDAALNQQFETVGKLMGISSRAAIWYAPDDLPAQLAKAIAAAVAAQKDE